jgi:hypothetical protein
MGFIEKIKLLFKIQKPLGELAKSAKDVKTGWKTLKFWVTFLGTLASTAAALTGIIPPQVQLIVTTILQALYNIIRGAEKMESADAKGIFTTTEFALTALGEVQKGIVAAQMGGINPEWMAAATTIVGMALAAGQSLAAREPEKPTTPK